MHIRSVEKTLRMIMGHLLRHSSTVSYSAQINEALIRQKQRMEAAFTAEQAARKARRGASAQALGKHPMEAESSSQAAKRAKYEVQRGLLEGRGIEFDVSTLQIETVIDVVMEGLGVISADDLRRAFDVSKLSNWADGRMPAALSQKVDPMRCSCSHWRWAQARVSRKRRRMKC
jgi:symplekin